MLDSISIVTTSGSQSRPCLIAGHKVVIDLSGFENPEIQSFDLVFTFKHAISEIRNHDYNWLPVTGEHVASGFSPKVIRLSNGIFVQPNFAGGIWEIKKKQPRVLFWRFNPKDAAPLTVYTKPHNDKKLAKANSNISFPENPALLFSAKNAIEFSRSVYPFSAIACFTDHCDFDTPESLQLQREFFRDCGVKVTKGFFMNHFSKRADNASFENDAAELIAWKDDGHELAYHSLSQSIKTDEESFGDFSGFVPPFPDIPTWIDHGYQPYNFSLYQSSVMTDAVYAAKLRSKNIHTLWNYIDSGTATTGVINQINPDDFTLGRFYEGIKKLKFSDRAGMMIKSIMFHYYADEQLVTGYKRTAGHFKKLAHQKKISSLVPLFQNIIKLAGPLFKIALHWNVHKNKPFRLAKYAPVFFRHRIGADDFYVFQTLEMVDFRKALCSDNINKLIFENGLFIAHTYFSVPMAYHTGRVFSTPDTIDAEVSKNFHYLGTKIKEQKIWNPTLNELVLFLNNFEKILLDVDHDGTIIVKQAASLTYRTVN
ncbi:hypothetical protein FNO01nite_10170 [Flavobacterium noncentrifugens]|uniref:Polysaccharide deacetylase n=1 Tax=Flavobacterium noncentrifugens TaxID=1128970 RepID=A0A1G8V7J6_9FLAO|nr:hypothetical protein [Flavobacterium noncentrifugens]GEP50345.1 hypothetical protein FNO01nite_10170 [Flavobacterium noncentrifugens]SDJ61140.1 hypothetical protein SAMN04487935_1188 [Flavobacterium noncentrifugens]